MLGKPQNGWTIISYNGKEFAAASYIDDVPLMVLDELLAYYTEPEHKLNLVFDNEPIEFGFIEFAHEVYCVTNGIIKKKFQDDIPENMFVEFSEFFNCKYMITDVLINQLTKEVIIDIEMYFDAWVYWLEEPGYLEVSKEKERRELLKSKISELKNILSKNIFENNTLDND